MAIAAEYTEKEFDKPTKSGRMKKSKAETTVVAAELLKNKHIETTKKMNTTYNNLTEAVVAAINELKAAGSLSAYQVTQLIRQKTNQDEWTVVGCEARPNQQNIKFWINHDDVRRTVNELYANNELDALGFTGRQFNGSYMEYSFDVNAPTPVPTTPTVVVPVDPAQITSVPASSTTRVNLSNMLGQRVVNTVANLRSLGGAVTLKRVQSALKENGVTCQDLYDVLAPRLDCKLSPGPYVDYYSQYVVE
jgi:hypothetical protein